VTHRSTAVLCFALLASLATARTYHVEQQHPKASDGGPGSAEQPWKTISKAAETLGPGDTVVIHAGTYREHVQPARSGKWLRPITYQAAEGEKVILTGADVVTGWKPHQGKIWKKEPWAHRFPVHPAAQKLVGRCEQVIVDDALLEQVLTVGEMKPGTFCADTDAKVLYAWLADGSDPNTHEMQASVRMRCFGLGWKKPPRHRLRLRGLTIRYAASMAQRGALKIHGDHCLVEDCEVGWCNGNGISFRGKGVTFRRVRSHHNGQQGMGGGGRGFRLEEVVLDHNNVKGYPKGWEAGGVKITHSRDGVLRRCQAIGNDGVGLWFDIDVRDVLVEQCTCAGNTGHGIFVEISGGFRIRHNMCVGNGTDDRWGMGGIAIAESDRCTIEHNTCVANPTGISIREQGPRTFKGVGGEQVSYRVQGVTIRRNIMALNTKYQFGLWSDNVFFGPHPSPKVGSRGTPYDPDECAIRLDRNLYWKTGTQQLALWGCPWRKKHAKYDDLAAWQRERGQDAHSLLADPLFVGPKAGNWSLQPDSPAHRLRAGPRKPPASPERDTSR